MNKVTNDVPCVLFISSMMEEIVLVVEVIFEQNQETQTRDKKPQTK